MVFVSPGELLVGCFGCTFDAGVECENVCVGEGGVLAPHFPEDAFELLCLGDPGGEVTNFLVGHLSGGGEGEEEGDVGGVALPLMPALGCCG